LFALHPTAGFRPTTFSASGRNGNTHRKKSLSIPARRRAGFGELVLFAYLIVTRIGFLPAAKLGFRFGSVPVFLTDMVLLCVTFATLLTHTNPLSRWALSGKGAGSAGLAVWALCLLSLVYFAFAVSEYGVLAARDLAIFGYSLFFPVAFFCLGTRDAAVRTVRVFVYSGVALAVLLVLQASLGLGWGFFGTEARVVGDHVVMFVGTGDVGGFVAFSLAGIVSYAVFGRRHRVVHLMLAAACLAALAIVATRAAVFGLALCGVAMLGTVESKDRHRFVFLICLLLLVGVGTTFLPEDIAGVARLHKFYLAVGSAMGGANDGNAAFRLTRWKYVIDLWSQHPLLGIGFGEALYPSWLISPDEAVGEFNVGMPHNTYLMILARVGIVGLSLILFSLLSTLCPLFRSGSVGGTRNPDSMAAANVIICMTAFAGFVLFFERPMHGAAFWIILAVAYRLAGPTTARQQSTERRGRSVRHAFLGKRGYPKIRAGNVAPQIQP
jgi:O-antigen ligase